LLAEHRTVFVGVLPGSGFLVFVIAADAHRGGFERGTLFDRQAQESRFQLGLREFQLNHALRVHAVKTVGVGDHRFIAAEFHVGENVSNALFDLRVLRSLERQEGFELRLKIGRSGIKAAQHGVSRDREYQVGDYTEAAAFNRLHSTGV